MKTSFSQEKQTLLRFLSDPQSEIQVSQSLVRLATRAGVLDLLAKNPKVRKQLGPYLDQYLATAALGALKLQNLRKISKAMEQAGIQIMPIKGMAYALMFGSGGPRRPMADIDILVCEDDYQKAIGTMRELGYEDLYCSRASRAKGHNERAMIKNAQLVEIHRAFVIKGRISVDYGALFDRSRGLCTQGVNCRIMSAEDGFLYHCFHMGLHEFAVGGLRSVMELLDLLEKDPPDVDLAAKRVRRWGSKRITWCALQIANKCLPGRIDSNFISRFAPCPGVRICLEHSVLRPSVNLAFQPDKLPRPIQLLRKAVLMDRAYLAPGYLARYLFNTL